MSLYDTKINLQSSKDIEDFGYFITKNKDKITTGSLLSFVYPLNNIDLINSIAPVQEKFESLIFIKRPQKNYSFIATDPVINLEFDQNNFIHLEPFIGKLSDSLISNWSDYHLANIPLITGGAKFNSKSRSEEWTDFKSFHFFVPGIIILRDEEKSFLISNHKVGSEFNEEKILQEEDSPHRQSGS